MYVSNLPHKFQKGSSYCRTRKSICVSFSTETTRHFTKLLRPPPTPPTPTVLPSPHLARSFECVPLKIEIWPSSVVGFRVLSQLNLPEMQYLLYARHTVSLDQATHIASAAARSLAESSRARNA